MVSVDIYLQEKCARCGDVRRELDRHDVDYDAYFLPPENPDIEALEFPIRNPVLVDEDRAPNGIDGHDEILDWISENYS